MTIFAPGPIRGSFWIEPSRLLAGPYPLDELERLREVGVFVDLTGEDEGLEAYAEQVADARVIRRPIPDFGIPTVEEMWETLDAIERELEGGNVVYLHCHYGIGRTGITLASYLIRRGSSVDAALASLRTIRKGPEAPEQVAFLARFAREAESRGRGQPDAGP